MGLLDFFVKPNLDSLRNQGGMEKKYSTLISLINSLTDDEDEGVSLKHQSQKQLIKENHLVFKINFRKPRMIFQILDMFELIHKANVLEVKYRRDTKNVLPIGPKILPETFQTNWTFDNGLEQGEMFKRILSDLVSTYSQKYRFSDQTFQRRLQQLTGVK